MDISDEIVTQLIDHLCEFNSHHCFSIRVLYDRYQVEKNLLIQKMIQSEAYNNYEIENIKTNINTYSFIEFITDLASYEQDLEWS